MEELVQKIEELIAVLDANAMPLWISIIGIFVPIILSVILIGITIYQHKKSKAFQALINDKNEELQKLISDKELKVQMHGDILSIYDGYCLAQNTICRSNYNSAIIFYNPNLSYQWSNDLFNSMTSICQAYNRAELLLPKSDKKLRLILKNILDKYKYVCLLVNEYNSSGAAELSRQQTWQKISASYGLLVNDYIALNYNINAAEDFVKLYANEKTREIDNVINEAIALFEYDKFDKYFEPYLRMYTEQ